MKSKTQHVGKLEILMRLPSSYYGNPRFLAKIDGFVCRTSPDSQHGYSIQNYDGKTVRAILGTHYGHCTIDSLCLESEE